MNLFTKQKQTYRYPKQTYGYQRGDVGGGHGLGVGGQQMQTVIQRMDKPQGHTVDHRELYSIPCNKA